MSTLQAVRKYELGQIGLIGEEIYRREIRPKVFPQYKEQFLALDIETHEYEIDPDADESATRLHARRPDARLM
jgi:hypothetical protein